MESNKKHKIYLMALYVLNDTVSLLEEYDA